jgi:hypothetical protein
MKKDKKVDLVDAQEALIDQAFEDIAKLAEIFHGRDLFSILGILNFFAIVTVIENIEGKSKFMDKSDQGLYEA